MPVFGSTDVQIMNRALAMVGQPYDTVTSVDGTDTTKWGTWAGLEYQGTRNSELRQSEWKFAVKRASLGAATTLTNNTGFWYAYAIPADCLFTCFLYSIMPQWLYTYPRKYLHIVRTPYINEDQYYTDLDPMQGNPYVKYIREMPLGTSYTDPDFVDAFILRLASKILPPATANLNLNGISSGYLQEYMGILQRAKGRNALDSEDDLPTEEKKFWSDRGDVASGWGGP